MHFIKTSIAFLSAFASIALALPVEGTSVEDNSLVAREPSREVYSTYDTNKRDPSKEKYATYDSAKE
ncbi:hypothetical protein F5Y10DRAFT_266667 [Nemania abortiva]|nr:hypothetical protein F5Y10DRAFT_266667 [Nemania abortiva]